jgi:hypothetical protein
MSIYISGSSGCEGELRGIFSGSLPVHPTASYYNDTEERTCTGSLVVSTYVSASTTTQRVHAYLDDGDGASWTLLGGQPLTYSHSNISSGSEGAVVDTITSAKYRPGTTIFIDASFNAGMVGGGGRVAYTMEPAATAGSGAKYDFICNGAAGTRVTVGFTGSSGEINYNVSCNDGNATNNGRDYFSFVANQFKQGTYLTCISDGNAWYFTGVAKCDADKIVNN